MDDKSATEKRVETKLPERDAAGRLLAPDGLPAHAHSRAAALKEKGVKSDPLKLVADELIALSAAPAPEKKAAAAAKKE